MALRFAVLRGSNAEDCLDAVAALRIEVFAEWPYLYAGDAAYERRYLARYLASPRAILVLALDGDAVVGASTGIPLAEDAAEFQRPFIERGIDPARVFYCGESVLRRAYRGQGAGHAFFDHREAEAVALGLPITAFCAVDRDPADPRRPLDHRGNDAFWKGRGYRRQAGMTCTLNWPEPARGDCAHGLTFWLRDSRAPA